MTYEEFRSRWESLSEAQQARVKAKARWEHMTPWAVMNEWWQHEDPEPLD